MAGYKYGCLALAVLLVAGILISGHQVSAQGCEGDLEGLVEQCEQFVQKQGPQVPPSQACCDVVKKANISCVCQHITKEVEQMISIDKVFYVAKYCGNPIPQGTQCGSSKTQSL
uniref:Bifunctional inhibitor/plant lipid transfer protein/seed storage helical domain-containing protein n=1 Tax=Nelumbo nucifera TaxID=4432 RepID=A0A822ZGH0_NELNU|nr:TPA_asm: hypothetical protein HUJ06_000799 [Nelumbo nucifera]